MALDEKTFTQIITTTLNDLLPKLVEDKVREEVGYQIHNVRRVFQENIEDEIRQVIRKAVKERVEVEVRARESS